MTQFLKMSDIIKRNAYIVKPEHRTAMQMAADLYINSGDGVIRYDVDYAPYMQRALEIMTSRAYVEFACVGSSRSAKTKTILEAFINWQIRCACGDMFIYCSTQTKANTFGSKDIERCIRNTPELDKFAIYSKDKWKIAEKSFTNGMTITLGSATETSTSATGYKSVIATDYDRTSDDLGKEGQRFELIAGRTTNLGTAAMAAAESSPARQLKRRPKDTTPHWHPCPDKDQGIAGLYNQGTRERFYWQCRDCDSYFIPSFECLKWDELETPQLSADTAFMMCPHCSSVYRDKDKPLMNKNALKHGLSGYFQEYQIDENGRQTNVPYKHSNRGSIWFEGTVIVARTWRRIVERYLLATAQYDKYGDESQLKTFANTFLGRNYVMQCADDYDIEVNWLIERARKQAELYPYKQGIVPAWGRYLIMTVDIQNGKNSRFSVQANVFSKDGLRMAIIDRFEILADENGDRVNPAREVDSWKLLIKQVMCKTYQIDESNETMRPIKTVADMGGTVDKGKTSNVATSTTEIAYQFVKYLQAEQLDILFELSKGAARHTMKGFYNYSDNERSAHADACPYIEMNGNMLSNSIRNAITRKGDAGFTIILPAWMIGTKKIDWFDEIIAEDVNQQGIWECDKSVRNEAVDLTKMALSCSLWLNDGNNKDHQNDWIDNPYVDIDNNHIFGKPISRGIVEFSDAALEAFGGW